MQQCVQATFLVNICICQISFTACRQKMWRRVCHSLMVSLEFFGAPKRNMPKTKNCWRSFGAPARAGLLAHRNTSDAETLWQRLLVSAWWTVNWIFGAHLLSFWSAGTVSFRQIKIVLSLPFSKMDNRKRLLLKLRKLKLRRRALLLSYKMRLHAKQRTCQRGLNWDRFFRGEFARIVTEIRSTDPELFFSYFRMDRKSFDDILEFSIGYEAFKQYVVWH